MLVLVSRIEWSRIDEIGDASYIVLVEYDDLLLASIFIYRFALYLE